MITSTSRVVEADVEDELVGGSLLLAHLDDGAPQELVLVLVLNDKKGGVERQLATEALRVLPRQLLVATRDVDARAVVENALRHTLYTY